MQRSKDDEAERATFKVCKDDQKRVVKHTATEPAVCKNGKGGHSGKHSGNGKRSNDRFVLRKFIA